MDLEQRLKHALHEQVSEAQATDAELRELGERNARLLRIIVAFMVLHGRQSGGSRWEFSLPRQPVDRIPLQNFTLDHGETPDAIVLTLRQKTSGSDRGTV